MERLVLIMNRDSVCMADDCESHKYRVEIDKNATLEKLAAYYLRLPHIVFGHATWILKMTKEEKDLCYIAVAAQQWKKPKLLIENISVGEIINKYGSNEFHAEYLCQTNPKKVYKKLLSNPCDIDIIRENKFKNYGILYRIKSFLLTRIYLRN